MAIFQAQYAYFLEDNGEYNFTITGSTGSFNYEADDQSSGSSLFTIDDIIAVNGPFMANQEFAYIGFIPNGWVGWHTSDFELILLTNTEYELGEAITADGGDFAVCFLAGTAIACPEGRRPVEDLAVGDLVLTADGGVRPVRFVGRQSYVTVFADPLRTRPIRIAAGALGEGLPARGLCVSPDHALLVDGVLVQAGALVNGTTIARMTDPPERFTYYHVELEDHSLILAEGVPAETFVDNVTRRRFDNYAEFAALYGDARSSMAELVLPRIKSARQLPAAVRQRLQERAVELVGTPTATAA